MENFDYTISFLKGRILSNQRDLLNQGHVYSQRELQIIERYNSELEFAIRVLKDFQEQLF